VVYRPLQLFQPTPPNPIDPNADRPRQSGAHLRIADPDNSEGKMNLRGVILFVGLFSISPIHADEGLKLPPEVTPALRAACETDVRRLCIGENPTMDSVKKCVEQKYAQLGSRCKVQLVAAGFSR
jgi:hypothetical protein